MLRRFKCFLTKHQEISFSQNQHTCMYCGSVRCEHEWAYIYGGSFQRIYPTAGLDIHVASITGCIHCGQDKYSSERFIVAGRAYTRIKYEAS